jgi:alpha-D-ribose 1-methylphosphonate 5-triphosphate synthase subunit PhnG
MTIPEGAARERFQAVNHTGALDRERYSRIFALANVSLLESLAETVVAAAERVELLQEPAPSLVMMEANDPVSGATFYVGEVLVTSCQVLIDGRFGCSTTIGDDERRARAAALLDAALQDPGQAADLLEQLVEEERRIDRTHRAESALAARTRVQFETMEDRDTGNALRPRI